MGDMSDLDDIMAQLAELSGSVLPRAAQPDSESSDDDDDPVPARNRGAAATTGGSAVRSSTAADAPHPPMSRAASHGMTTLRDAAQAVHMQRSAHELHIGDSSSGGGSSSAGGSSQSLIRSPSGSSHGGFAMPISVSGPAPIGQPTMTAMPHVLQSSRSTTFSPSTLVAAKYRFAFYFLLFFVFFSA